MSLNYKQQNHNKSHKLYLTAQINSILVKIKVLECSSSQMLLIKATSIATVFR